MDGSNTSQYVRSTFIIGWSQTKSTLFQQYNHPKPHSLWLHILTATIVNMQHSYSCIVMDNQG